MRHIPAAAIAACLCASPSLAADECATPGTPTANTGVVKGFYGALNAHSGAALDTVLAKDWVDTPPAPGQGPGLEGMKTAMAGYFASFPDFAVNNQDFIAAGDKVVVRSIITATQRGPFAEVPATNKPVRLMAIDIHEVCAGRITQTWHVEDWLSALFQLGVMPPKS